MRSIKQLNKISFKYMHTHINIFQEVLKLKKNKRSNRIQT